MIRYHTFNVGGAGTGAIDLVTGNIEFMLNVIPNTEKLPVDVSFKYDSSKAANAFDGGFTLDINGGEQHQSISTNGNTTTITARSNKQMKFTFEDSGNEKRLLKIEDFDDEETDFIYTNNLLIKVTRDNEDIKLSYDGSNLKEILAPTKIGMEIIRNGNNFTLSEVSYIDTGIRYIRDWLNGSTANTGNHWILIDAWGAGTNWADGVVFPQVQVTTPASSWGTHSETGANPPFFNTLRLIVNQQTDASHYLWTDEGLQNVMIDLGQLRDIEFLKVWHYYHGTRAYHNTKTEVSKDGIDWFTIFDSTIDGAYTETSSGRTSLVRRVRNSVVITRPAPISTSATVNMPKTGATLTKSFDFNTDRMFLKEDLHIYGVCKQKTTEFVTYNDNAETYSVVCKQDKFQNLLVVGDFPTPSLSDPQVATLIGKLNDTNGQWMINQYNADKRFMAQYFNPKKVKNAAGQIITQTVSKELAYTDDKLTSETVTITETGKPNKVLVTGYQYVDDKLDTIISPNGMITEIEYDANGNEESVKMYHSSDPLEVIIVEAPDDNQNSTQNDSNYAKETFANGFLAKLVGNSTQVDYEYECWGRRSSVKLGSVFNTSAYVDNAYNDSINKSLTSYASGEVFSAQNDNSEKTIGIKRGAAQIVEYAFDNKNRLASINDTNDDVKITVLQYGDFDEVTQIQNGDVTITPFVDNDGNVEQLTYQVQGRPIQTYKYEYIEQNGSQMKTTRLGNTLIEQAEFDAFGRLKEISGTTAISAELEYETINGSATNLVKSQISSGLMEYTYDNEKIATVKKESVLVSVHEYDQYGRLMQENDFVYGYDNDGNILFKKQLPGNKLINSYSYTNNLLTSFNGQTIAYDILGNPTIYRNKALTWDFKSLRQFEDVSFKYTADGLRTQKSKGNVANRYYWAGDKLLAEKRTTMHNSSYIPNNGFKMPLSGLHHYERQNNIYIDYIYGTTGIIGFDLQYDDGVITRYWYKKNIQGDITHIYDANGILKAEYVYDAWGNGTIAVNVDDIANVNSIRYRGYYFDAETKLYYLKSRYYDSETGRFISQDSINTIDATRGMVNGLNLNMYCANDPINMIDSTGLYPEPMWKNFTLKQWIYLHIIHKVASWWEESKKRGYLFSSSPEENSGWYFGVFSASGPSFGISNGGVGFSLFSFDLALLEKRTSSTLGDSYLSHKFGTMGIGFGAEINFGNIADSNVGFEAQVAAYSFGVYTPNVDAEMLVGSIGLTAGYNKGTIKFGISLGIGFKVTIRLW